LFLVWIYVAWRSAGLTRNSSPKERHTVGLAGQLFLLTFIAEGFSVDSFAWLDDWIMFGLISAGGALYRKELQSADITPALVLAEG
jgi:hypothetical protein